ncbi:helix-turn-helix domain-containing protein [Marinitenerispora sediminis]|uniref:DNA-binding protein n=1 Tax=Marinitenerispora sediminis TaxID=1931232 RepID=A0A368T6E5_9ACTN|nr:helix-turn-helix transcriptional regulator [Marinitenerispora sediminis]RCV53242.1 DNA-binding protein [Marinitenerispora sediminis]RCV54941.1 DNA-binding protein [Marinitenerispora sediminis]RCV59064.1 DNA-binding protein [Marinitenerispora sediminis]
MTPAMPVRRRHLIRELKRFRLEAGLSQDEVSGRMGWDRGKIHRLESGRLQRVKASDVIALCDLYKVSDVQREALAEIARNSRRKGWWFAYQDVLPGPFIGLEAEALSICDFNAMVIPGLFQTPDYLASLMESATGVTVMAHEVHDRINARRERQASVLDRDLPPRLWVILDEAALRREVGGREIMEAQIRHLLELGHRPNINIQVLPFDIGAHAASGFQFTILQFSDVDSVVYIEGDQDGLYLEEESKIRRYTLIFDRLQASAMSVEKSTGFLESLV